jgi:hypothetical protein
MTKLDTQSALVAANQIREQMITAGLRLSKRLTQARDNNLSNVKIAVLKSGGMALIADAAGKLRLSSVDDSRVLLGDPEALELWNSKAPDLEVRAMRLEDALVQEQSKVWQLLQLVQECIEILENIQ